MQRLRVLLFTAIVLAVSAEASADVTLGQLLPKVAPGGEVALAGDKLEAKTISDYSVAFKGSQTYGVPVERLEATRLVLRVPRAVAVGRYLVYVGPAAGPEQLIGQIEIVAVAPLFHRFGVISTWSKLLMQEQFDFRVVGERLCVDTAREAPSCSAELVPVAKPALAAGKEETLTLLFGAEPLVLEKCSVGSIVVDEKPATTVPAGSNIPAQAGEIASPPAPAAGSAPTGVLGRDSEIAALVERLRSEKVTKPCYLSESAEALSVHGIDVSDRGGPHNASIEIAGVRSNQITLRISRVTPRMLKWMSLGLMILLIAPFGFFGTRVVTASAREGGSSLLAWALTDAETNTYSLSKSQLLLWTVAIAYGYVYLLLAHVLAQGKLAFPPFPGELTGVLFGAGGTSLLSSVVSRSRGSKGAGGTEASLSDLVSSGGVLAADRAQFLVWTLIGVGGFLFILLRDLPEKIATLPPVDPQLLGAMGVSSLVYVLGKSVRLPGPVISKVTPAVTAASFVLGLEGQNLHKSSIVSIDGQPVDASVAAPVSAVASTASPNLVSQLTVQMDPSGPWRTGDHLLRVTNLDGQYAEVWFTANAPTLTAVAPTTIPSGEKTQVTLTGTHLRPGSGSEWLAPGSTAPTVLDSTKLVNVTSDTSATVTLDPGKVKGVGTLTLVSPRGARVSQQVTVT